MKKNTKQRFNEIEDHIMEVDNNHGQILVKMERQLAQLEYKLAYIQQVVEQRPDWLNQPVTGTPPGVTPGVPFYGDPAMRQPYTGDPINPAGPIVTM